MDKFKAVLLYFWRDLTPREKIYLGLIFLIASFSAVAMSASPLILAFTTDQLVANSQLRDPDWRFVIALSVFAYLFCISITRITDTFSQYLQNVTRFGIGMQLSVKYFRHLYSRDTTYFNSNNAGRIAQSLQQADSDTATILGGITTSFVTPIIQLATALFVLAVHGHIAIISAFLLYGALFILGNVYWNKKMIPLRQAFIDHTNRSYVVLADSVANIRLAKQFGSFNYFYDRYKLTLEGARDSHSGYGQARIASLALNTVLFITLFLFSFIWVTQQVLNGETSIGNFILVATYVIFLSAPLEALGSRLSQISQSTASLSRFLESDAVAGNNGQADSISFDYSQSAVDIQDIDFSYDDEGPDLLRGLQLKVNRGEKLAIIGANGSGKSTLLSLISGQQKPKSGNVKIFGVLAPEVLKSKLGYVTQDIYIFQDTLLFNLKIARPNATDEELNAALEFAEIADFVKTLPNGLATAIGVAGSTLSGGQRQRLSLARVFLQRPEIILIDEGTSSLDALAEKDLLENVFDQFRESTIIVVSHRPMVLKYVDRICVMSAGNIVEEKFRSEALTDPAFLALLANKSA